MWGFYNEKQLHVGLTLNAKFNIGIIKVRVIWGILTERGTFELEFSEILKYSNQA